MSKGLQRNEYESFERDEGLRRIFTDDTDQELARKRIGADSSAVLRNDRQKVRYETAIDSGLGRQRLGGGEVVPDCGCSCVTDEGSGPGRTGWSAPGRSGVRGGTDGAGNGDRKGSGPSDGEDGDGRGLSGGFVGEYA